MANYFYRKKKSTFCFENTQNDFDYQPNLLDPYKDKEYLNMVYEDGGGGGKLVNICDFVSKYLKR